MQIFLDEFASAYPTTFNIMMMDNSGAHKAKRLRIPANIGLVFQPPANPNSTLPSEFGKTSKATWRGKPSTIWLLCSTNLVKLLGEYDADTLRSLTGYPYLLRAIQAICPCSAQVMSGV